MTGIPTQRARALRRDAPFPERLVWSRIRSGQLEGWKFRRQHPVGRYIADFACVELRLIVELDGDTHGEATQVCRDAARTAYLEAEGWQVIRFWNAEVMDSLDGVLQQISDAARAIAMRRG
jgi:very-short-patch-repair endonuclease